MSSFKNASKSHRKTHRERPQLSNRTHIGQLEKKKDYKLRAQEYQRKQATLKQLKQKALDRNPDEFYFKMIRSKVKDDIHETPSTEPAITADQLKLIKTQDIKYINYKRSIERKKIEKLKSTLHLLDVEAEDKPKNTHTFFVDSKKEVKNFNLAERLQTHKDLVSCHHNRPRLNTLQRHKIKAHLTDGVLEEFAEERRKQSSELCKRIERERQLDIVAQKMQLEKHLMDKKSQKKKVKDETIYAPAQYRWVPKRKR